MSGQSRIMSNLPDAQSAVRWKCGTDDNPSKPRSKAIESERRKLSMEVIYLVGAAQGMFLAALLASRDRNTLPNRLLAGLMLAFSIDLAMAVYHASAARFQQPALVGLDLPLAYLYRPLLHGAVYLGLVIVVLRRHGRRLRETQPSDEHMRLRWLRNLTAGVVTMLALSALFYALGGRNAILGMDPLGTYDDLTLLALTVFVYAIGYLGLRQPAIMAPHVEVEPEASFSDRVHYARSGMDSEEAARHRDRLVALMETEHLYRRSDLTLQDLVDVLSITPHNLTEVLSTQLDQRFYDFVNGYRVREVQARLTDPSFADWTILAIGMEAGFNAKSSFGVDPVSWTVS